MNKNMRNSRYMKDYVLEKHLLRYMSKGELARFYRWIQGQTCPIVKGQRAYFKWDVDRFMLMARCGVPAYWD